MSQTGSAGLLERLRVLVGGFAVSTRAEPRTTRDIDVAVAVADDRDAERVILALRYRGYRDAGEMREHDVTGRLATMRMVTPEGDDTVVDVLFASTGIEPEIMGAATALEVLPDITVPVASLGRLLAMKVLAGRTQDLADFVSLLRGASPATPTSQPPVRSRLGTPARPSAPTACPAGAESR